MAITLQDMLAVGRRLLLNKSSKPKFTVTDLYQTILGSTADVVQKEDELLHALSNMPQALQIYVNVQRAEQQQTDTADALIDTLTIVSAFAKITGEKENYYQWRQRYAKNIMMSPQKTCEALDVTVRQQEESLVQVDPREVEKLTVGSGAAARSKNRSNEKEGAQRTLMLLGLLKRVDINIQDERQCYAVVGKLGQEEYTLICLPGLQYKILVCDKYANATFVRRDPHDQYQGGLTKANLQVEREARRIIYTPQNIAGRESKVLIALGEMELGLQTGLAETGKAVIGGAVENTKKTERLQKMQALTYYMNQSPRDERLSINPHETRSPLMQALQESKYEERRGQQSESLCGFLPRDIAGFTDFFSFESINKNTKKCRHHPRSLRVKVYLKNSSGVVAVIKWLMIHQKQIKQDDMLAIYREEEKAQQRDKQKFIDHITSLHQQKEQRDRLIYRLTMIGQNPQGYQQRCAKYAPIGECLLFPTELKDFALLLPSIKTNTYIKQSGCQRKKFGHTLTAPFVVLALGEIAKQNSSLDESSYYQLYKQCRPQDTALASEQFRDRFVETETRQVLFSLSQVPRTDLEELLRQKNMNKKEYQKFMQRYNSKQPDDYLHLPTVGYLSRCIIGVDPDGMSPFVSNERRGKGKPLTWYALVDGQGRAWRYIIQKFLDTGEGTKKDELVEYLQGGVK